MYATELEYVPKAAELVDRACDEAYRLAEPGADEGDILAAMQGIIFSGGGDLCEKCSIKRNTTKIKSMIFKNINKFFMPHSYMTTISATYNIPYIALIVNSSRFRVQGCSAFTRNLAPNPALNLLNNSKFDVGR